MTTDEAPREILETVPPSPARFLRRRYAAALAIISLLLVSSQIFIQAEIDRSLDDSSVVDIGGRQRMLSQKIAKTALELCEAYAGRSRNGAKVEELAGQLEADAKSLSSSHEALLNGNPSIGLRGRNSRAVLDLFAKIDAPYQAVVAGARALAAQSRAAGASDASLLDLADPIIENEEAFLLGMDDIAFQYDAEATARVRAIRLLELLLFLATLLTIAGEALLIFRPASRKIDAYSREISRAMRLLEERAARDGMTGLYNKRTGLLMLEREMARARRERNGLCLCFLDLDGLKATNDRRGHDAGDLLITDFAEALRRVVREEDVAFRFGGDEFAVAMGGGAEAARGMAERLRREARSRAGGSELPIEFSVGIEAYDPAAHGNVEALVAAADGAMYEDKRRRKAAAAEIGSA